MRIVLHQEAFEQYLEDSEGRAYTALSKDGTLMFYIALGHSDWLYVSATPMVERPVKDYSNVSWVSFFKPPFGLEIESDEKRLRELGSFLAEGVKKQETRYFQP